MAELHWMPLYIGDYLRDTGHLTGAQHGAYLLLLMHHWANGPLPTEEKQLARIAKTAPVNFKKMKRTVLSFFDLTEQGYVQKRVMKERQKQIDISAKRSAAGRLGGRPSESKSFEFAKAKPNRVKSDQNQSQLASKGEANNARVRARPSRSFSNGSDEEGNGWALAAAQIVGHG